MSGPVDKVVVGFLPQLAQAAVMLPIGILLFALSFLVLWTNEGLPRYGDIAETSTVASASDTSGHEGQFVAVTGTMTTSGEVGDPLFFEPGPYANVIRVHEQYAWHEHVDVSEQKRWGGRREQTRTYSYVPEWTAAPPSAENFRDPTGHETPPARITGSAWSAPSVRIGAWSVPTEGLDLPGTTRLRLDEVTLVNEGARAARHGQRLYLDGADPSSPRVGDERVTFYVVRDGEFVTAFGQARLGALEPGSAGRGKAPMLRVVSGDRAAAIEGLHLDDQMRTIVLRLIGFAMMWGGLFLIPSLAYTLLDIIPFMGTVARIGVALLTLIVAAGLSTLVVGLSIVGHNPLWTAGVLAAMVGIIVLLYYVTPLFRRDARRNATSAA